MFYIHSVDVISEYQSKGIGTKLMEFTLDLGMILTLIAVIVAAICLFQVVELRRQLRDSQKEMAEELTDYLKEHSIKVKYMHSDIDTLERVDIVNGLRLGEFDVLCGINLLREGLDLPEVRLVAILDADKEGFLRSDTALIQTIGRAARNSEGRVIMYADTVTDSMKRAIGETNRRRAAQDAYNKAHGIVPKTIVKEVKSTLNITKKKTDDEIKMQDIPDEIEKLKALMKVASGQLDFERAIEIREKIAELKMKLRKAQR